MQGATVLAYLGGLVDGDGYFKITRNHRTPRTEHPYYATVLGLAQLWPGEVVCLFADTLGGEVKQVVTENGTPMARCELRGRRAESAARRLAPFLPLKRSQAVLFLEAARLRPRRRGRTLQGERGHDSVEKIARALIAVQRGLWDFATEPLPVSARMNGYGRLTHAQLGWTHEETLAYLAGVMESDGNFRIYRQRVAEMRWLHYRINIRCAQVVPSPAIALLSATFGGRVAVVKATRPNCRDLASWNLHDRAASSAIEELLPYLRVKWVDACLLLELRHMKSRGKEDLTEWEHRTRWQRVIKMRKRSCSGGQVAEFERIRRALLSLHGRRSTFLATAPGARG